MQAIRAASFGGPEVMRLEELPTPSPAVGEALVRVEASGINFIDVYQRQGLYKIPLPARLGLEGAGVVEALGAGVSRVKVGDRVAWVSLPGSYATHAALPADRLVAVPAGISSKVAASTMLQGLTAHYLATSTYPLQSGQTCLIHAAAGGVGQLFIQIAKKRGARVIGTAGGPEKCLLAKAAGADECIDYSATDFESAVKRLTGGRGVAVVYDSVGKDTFGKSLKCLEPRGMAVLFGQSSGPVEPVDPQVLAGGGSLYLTRPTLGSYTVGDELFARCAELFGWIGKGELKIRIDSEYPLGEAKEAHQALEGRRTTGKVLLVP